MESQNNKNMSFSDEERLHARMKSYVGPSILVLFLYFLFYIPGLIANYVYRKEAKQMEHVAGQKLSGTGCLGFMFWLNILNIPLLLLTLIILLLYAFGKTIYKQFSDIDTIKELGKASALILFISLFITAIVQISDVIFDIRYFSKFFPFEALGYVSLGIASAWLIFSGINKKGWGQSLLVTLKKIARNFIEILSDIWDFIDANYKEDLTFNQ
jgi:hypothetical protein